MQPWQQRAARLPSVFSMCLAQRRSERSAADEHQSFKGAHTAFAATSGLALLEEQTPASYAEAMKSPDSAK